MYDNYICDHYSCHYFTDIQGNLPIICQFEPPISEKIHIKAEVNMMHNIYYIKHRIKPIMFKICTFVFKKRILLYPSKWSCFEEMVHKEVLLGS